MQDLSLNYAFIDGANLELSTKKDQDWKLDYQKFRVYLTDKYNINKAFYFVGKYMLEYLNLYTSLEKYGYILVFAKAKNADVDLTVYAMKECDKYNKAIIVSGDGDFCCLFGYLKEQGKLLKILVPNCYSYSSLLRKFNSDIAFISDLRTKLEYSRVKWV